MYLNQVNRNPMLLNYLRLKCHSGEWNESGIYAYLFFSDSGQARM